VVSEALANVSKHADATKASIRVCEANGELLLEVADNGRGGANPSAGSGLRGLSDRVAAVEGRLTLVSPPGEGTRVVAHMPCA
ncbi:MAG TPA: ATP-binding protein, partial [Candidatus Sulfotelmatobacter sp.]|nr:ATP-binding protein [Candidatus Sulfotelmatobacter sp.]